MRSKIIDPLVNFNYPRVRYAGTAGDSISSSATPSVIKYTTLQRDPFKIYDPSTGAATFPSSGLWRIKAASILFGAVTNNSNPHDCVMYITKNGTSTLLATDYKALFFNTDSGIAGDCSCSMHLVVEDTFEAGDSIYTTCFHRWGVTCTLGNTTSDSFIEIRKISN